jgi:hypothetical protein
MLIAIVLSAIGFLVSTSNDNNPITEKVKDIVLLRGDNDEE